MLKQGNTHTTDTVLLEPQHSHAICDEIGERLRVHLREEPELPSTLRRHIDRLRESEGLPPSAEHGFQNKLRLRRGREIFRNRGVLLATMLDWSRSLQKYATSTHETYVKTPRSERRRRS